MLLTHGVQLFDIRHRCRCESKGYEHKTNMEEEDKVEVHGARRVQVAEPPEE